MAFFAWDEKYSVGIQSIDNQHRKLIELTDRMHEAMRMGKGNEIIGEVLDSLVQYTVTHFRFEEQLMQEHGYPSRLSHKQCHADLVKRVEEIRDQYRGGRAMLTLEIMNFLKSWLTGHIQGEDMKYSPFLLERGVK